MLNVKIMIPLHLRNTPGWKSLKAGGYYVSTIGLDEAKICKYIIDQEINDWVEDKYDSDLSDPF